MRVDVSPLQAEIAPHQPLVLTISITNTTTVIGGYEVRLLGADPSWVDMPNEPISLFPDEVRMVLVTITPPKGLPAGTRRIAVQVRELTPPNDSSISEIDLTVPAARSIQLRVDPVAVTAGKKANFSVIAENTGNTIINGRLDGDDPEGRVAFAFEPEILTLAPGEHAVVDMQAKARRPLTGSPAVRVLGLYLDDSGNDAFFSRPDGEPAKGPRDEASALANGTFVQKSLLSRGAFSLLGLLVAVTVFALVITVALSRLVGQTTADRDLALQVAAARDGGVGSGSSSLSGSVKDLATGKGLGAVSISLFDASNTQSPIATAASAATTGLYTFPQLAAGKYVLGYARAGFVPVWYPAATAATDAKPITLANNKQMQGLDVTMGGVPASISGTVTGDDVAASTIYLETVPGAARGTTGSNADSTSPLPATGGSAAAGSTTGAAANPAGDPNEAIVQQVPVGADGTFTLTNVPSPSTYELVVTKTGYATTTQQLDVGAGETRTGVQLTLLKGDGAISGVVNDATSPIAGATITATVGTSTVTTVSQTGTGKFTLRNLPTPGSFTVTATAPGHSSQTQTVTLSSGRSLNGVVITLAKSSASLSGLVTELPGNTPATGVTVVATNGQLTVQTETRTGTLVAAQAGTWTIGALPVPATYTLTFSRADLGSQTIAVTLDATGRPTGASVTAAGAVDVTMQSATATMSGRVSQTSDSSVVPDICDAKGHLGEATVTLLSGSSTYVTTTASVADKTSHTSCGSYQFQNLPPGTYTMTVTSSSGTSPRSDVFTLSAGEALTNYNVTLDTPAAIQGKLTVTGGTPQNWTVFLYAAADYPNTVTTSVHPNADGTYAFNGIDAGEYVVAFSPTADQSAARQTITTTVQPGETKTLATVVVAQ